MDYIFLMPYIGGLLSDNSYKFGNRKRTTHPVVRCWMQDLEEQVRDCHIPHFVYYNIKLRGFFRDERCPDLSNLHKVIADALKRGLGVDDKYFRFQDLGFEVGEEEPYLKIVVEGKDE